MAASVLNKIEYLILLVAAFAAQNKVSEAEAYRYLSRYGALSLCEKHYGIMHTLALEYTAEPSLLCKKWAERASTYRIADVGYTDKDLKTFTRNIPADYYLRPIPQGQIDGMQMESEAKKMYQNPAYR